MSLTFAQFREVNVKRCEAAFFPLHDWNSTEWALAVVGEVGEMCNLLKKRNRGDTVDLKCIADEIADAQTYLDLLAASLGLDLEQITIEKFNEVSDRRDCSIKL